MKQAGCNMGNREAYIRSTVALIVSLIALQYEIWFLFIISFILFYTAYKKFCLMFSLLGINKKLSVENYYYALIPKYSPYSSCIFNKEGDVVYMNDAAKGEFGVIEKASDLGISEVNKYISSSKAFDTLFKRNEKTYQFHMRGIREEKVLLLHINNITEVLDLEYINANLENKVELALSENELKNHLLAQQSKFVTTGELIENITHQWKQPLSALSGLLINIQLRHNLQALSTEEMDEEMQKAAKLIHMMDVTVDDFKNFLKTDKEKLDFSISSCMSDVMLILGSSLKQENIKLVDLIDSDIYIEGYKNEFTQVLLNIINNSKDAFLQAEIKEREIEVKTLIKDENVILSICDTAGGISKENIDLIFQSHFTTKEEHGGTGIGLHMSKLIIEKGMNGNIMAQNYNQGVCFILNLPMKKKTLSNK